MKSSSHLLILVLLEFLAILSFSSSAEAGPGRRPLTPGAAPEPMPIRRSTSSSTITPAVLSQVRPLTWNSPYWRDGAICREDQGNVVCLKPEEAKKLRWSIPDPQ